MICTCRDLALTWIAWESGRGGCGFRWSFLVPFSAQESFSQVRAVSGVQSALLKMESRSRKITRSFRLCAIPLILPKLNGRTGRNEDRMSGQFISILSLITSLLPQEGPISVLRNSLSWWLSSIFSSWRAGAIPNEDNKRYKEQYKRCYK